MLRFPLPDDVHGLILGRCGVASLIQLSQVCRYFRRVTQRNYDYRRARRVCLYIGRPADRFSRCVKEGWANVAEWLLFRRQSVELFDLLPRDHLRGGLRFHPFDEEIRVQLQYQLTYLFQVACYRGHVAMARFLYLLDPSRVHPTINERLFKNCCQRGRLAIVQWLLYLEPTLVLESTFNYNHALTMAIRWGHLRVAQWIYSLDRDVSSVMDGYAAFYDAVWHDQIDCAAWLYQLAPLPTDQMKILYGKVEHEDMKDWFRSLRLGLQ